MADLENIGIAVGIALLASPGAEIYAFHGCRPPSRIFHFRFPPSLVVQYRCMSIDMADPENIGIAVGIAFLLNVEMEIIVLPYPLPV